MTDYEKVEKVIRYLDAHHAEQPDLKTLARVAFTSEFHFHRLFTRWAGVTPKEFLKLVTIHHAKALLAESRNVLHAALESGLSGPGRLHDLFVTVDGVTPGEFKASGAGMQIRHGFHPTPFGECLIGVTDRGVCFLSFVGRRNAALDSLKRAWPNATLREDVEATARTVMQIFRGKRNGCGNELKLFVKGSRFQLKVWEAILRIPPGRVLSYGDVAQLIDSPNATRAVGTALGRNPVALLIPCHRVIRETGALGGYRWGNARKRALLAWESSSAHATETLVTTG